MSVVRFDGVALEDIRIGAAVAVEMDTATGRTIVRALVPVPLECSCGKKRNLRDEVIARSPDLACPVHRAMVQP